MSTSSLPLDAPPAPDRHHRNRLLDALPSALRAELDPHLEAVTVGARGKVADPGEPIEYIYFPLTCIISVVAELQDGGTVETGTIGNEGVAGLPALLDAVTSEARTFGQVPGSALRAPTAVVKAMYDRDRDMRSLINRYVQAYISQVSWSAACNRAHGIEQRCARWLLMTHDRVQSAEFALKQEFLAQMLGVRRAGVSVAASALQEAALIKYTRGAIRVLDRDGLEAVSCECYRVIRHEFDRLVPP